MDSDERTLTPMLGALLRRPLRELSNRVEHDVAAAGFTDLRLTHFPVFQHMDAEGSRLTDLAARAQMTKQSMGALVDNLTLWGYVERIPDPNDGRARIIRRTQRGWDLERVARASVQAFHDEWAARIGQERLSEMMRVLAEFDLGTPPAR